MQMPTASKSGESRNLLSPSLSKEGENDFPNITRVPAVALKPSSISINERESNWTDDRSVLNSAKETEQHWINETLELLDMQRFDKRFNCMVCVSFKKTAR